MQSLEEIYLLYRRYWAYAAVIYAITTTTQVLLTRSVLKQFKALVGLSNSTRIVPTVQAGWVRAAMSYALVPGDVVVLQQGKASCDLVMLRGSCLVEESMLSGEVLCHAMPCRAVLCCAVLCYAMLCAHVLCPACHLL